MIKILVILSVFILTGTQQDTVKVDTIKIDKAVVVQKRSASMKIKQQTTSLDSLILIKRKNLENQ